MIKFPIHLKKKKVTFLFSFSREKRRLELCGVNPTFKRPDQRHKFDGPFRTTRFSSKSNQVNPLANRNIIEF